MQIASSLILFSTTLFSLNSCRTSNSFSDLQSKQKKEQKQETDGSLGGPEIQQTRIDDGIECLPKGETGVAFRFASNGSGLQGIQTSKGDALGLPLTFSNVTMNRSGFLNFKAKAELIMSGQVIVTYDFNIGGVLPTPTESKVTLTITGSKSQKKDLVCTRVASAESDDDTRLALAGAAKNIPEVINSNTKLPGSCKLMEISTTGPYRYSIDKGAQSVSLAFASGKVFKNTTGNEYTVSNTLANIGEFISIPGLSKTYSSLMVKFGTGVKSNEIIELIASSDIAPMIPFFGDSAVRCP